MKRALRFGVLVGGLAVAVWSSASREAAAADCTWLAGKGCTTRGATQTCTDPWGPGYCVCDSTFHWSCMV